MKIQHLVTLAGLLVIAGGCGESSDTSAESATPDSAAAAIDGSRFVLNEEPADGKDVIAVREDAADGDDIVIIGRIGGSTDPWIKGRAAFSIVDRSLKPCNEIPGDNCPVPWDYCCETDKLPTATALVKFNDDNGQLLKAGAQDLLDVKELDTVVIAGKAKRDEAGNLTVLASGLFVRETK